MPHETALWKVIAMGSISIYSVAVDAIIEPPV